jgi:hypothetical protein
VGVVAALALQAAPSLEEVAHLSLVDALCDFELGVAMSKTTVLTVIAVALLDPGFAELRLLQIRLLPKFCR